jgi:hypothetical protein
VFGGLAVCWIRMSPPLYNIIGRVSRRLYELTICIPPAPCVPPQAKSSATLHHEGKCNQCELVQSQPKPLAWARFATASVPILGIGSVGLIDPRLLGREQNVRKQLGRHGGPAQKHRFTSGHVNENFSAPLLLRVV